MTDRWDWEWEFAVVCISKVHRQANAQSWLSSTCGQNYTALIDGWLAPISCTSNYCKWPAPRLDFSREPLAFSRVESTIVKPFNRFRLMSNVLERSRREHRTRYSHSRTLSVPIEKKKMWKISFLAVFPSQKSYLNVFHLLRFT